jgi:septal ring-binding cell division protein DamX
VPTRPAPTPIPRAEKPARARSPIPAPAVAAGPPPAASASSSTRQYWLDRAAHDEKRFGGSKKKYAIQLELACEVTSLVDAFQHDRGGNMWLVTTPYEGKTCFRVLWGHYATPEAGHRALSSAPGFFSTGKNHPAVTAVR